MQNNSSGSIRRWHSVGDLHIAVRTMFERAGWGTTILKTVAKDNPQLMRRSLSYSSVSELMRHEDGRSLRGPWVTRGDYAATAALPIRTPALHVTTALASLGNQGVRGLVTNRQGYGLETYSSLVSGTF